MTVAMLRENAQNWAIDPDKIAVAGFSAGGNLAGQLSVYWKKNGLKKKQDIHRK